jgi:hypothetical protein
MLAKRVDWTWTTSITGDFWIKNAIMQQRRDGRRDRCYVVYLSLLLAFSLGATLCRDKNAFFYLSGAFHCYEEIW